MGNYYERNCGRACQLSVRLMDTLVSILEYRQRTRCPCPNAKFHTNCEKEKSSRKRKTDLFFILKRVFKKPNDVCNLYYTTYIYYIFLYNLTRNMFSTFNFCFFLFRYYIFIEFWTICYISRYNQSQLSERKVTLISFIEIFLVLT